MGQEGQSPIAARLKRTLKPSLFKVNLALSQRLSPLDLIFRSSTPTFDKMLLINFRIS